MSLDINEQYDKIMLMLLHNSDREKEEDSLKILQNVQKNIVNISVKFHKISLKIVFYLELKSDKCENYRKTKSV